MNDAQLISISITLLAIFAGSLYNHVRISDMAGRFADVNRRTEDLGSFLRAEMRAMHSEINLQFERTNNKIDALLKLVADLDQRVAVLETRKS